MHGTWKTTSGSGARALLRPTGGGLGLLSGVALIALVRLDPAGFALAAAEVAAVPAAAVGIAVAARRTRQPRTVEARPVVTALVVEQGRPRIVEGQLIQAIEGTDR